MTLDYWMIDNETGEEFFVELYDVEEKNVDDAWKVVDENFGKEYRMKNIRCLDVVSPEFAEMMGYDTY